MEVAETPGAESEQGACPASGARDSDDAPSEGPNSRITAVFLQLLPRVAGFMPRTSWILRLLCKAAAAALHGPQHATVHLSEPVPPAEFEWRWCGPQSLRSTTHEQRQQLVKLTARSGVVANLAALAEAHGGDLTFLPSPPSYWGPLEVAAGAGRLESCRWLHEGQGVPLTDGLLEKAAASGNADLCQWLHDRGCDWGAGEEAALRHGHVRLAEWLLRQHTADEPFSHRLAPYLTRAAAYGCDLATLQRLHAEHVASRGVDLTGWQGEYCLGAAAGSPTPDWAAKVEWLEGLGCPPTIRACTEAAHCKDAAARLAWLHARGYPVNAGCSRVAAEAGNAEALRYVLAQGLQLGPLDLPNLVLGACASGSLEAAQVLWDVGGRPDADALKAAAERGHLHIVSWAAEQLGDGAVISAGLFRAAAESGSLPLLRWLHERGCRWGAGTLVGAAKAGCEEALEWLAERGCPMGVDGAAYVEAAAKHDMPTLRCLARLGCPFAPGGGTFTSAAVYVGRKLPLDPRPLQWLLDTGCPVDWETAIRAPSGSGVHGRLREWLAAQRQQRA